MHQRRVVPCIVSDTHQLSWYLLEMNATAVCGVERREVRKTNQPVLLIGLRPSLRQCNCWHHCLWRFWSNTGDCRYMWEIQPLAACRCKCCNSECLGPSRGGSSSALWFSSSFSHSLSTHHISFVPSRLFMTGVRPGLSVPWGLFSPSWPISVFYGSTYRFNSYHFPRKLLNKWL